MVERVCVGALAGAFGVHGEVRLKSFCADPEAIAQYPLTTDDGGRSFSVVAMRPIKNGFAARVAGIATKEDADALRGTQLFADRSHLPDLDDDEYYYADLIGLSAFDTGGGRLGTVKAVLNHGAGDLLEIHDLGLRATVLVPFTRVIVPTVSLAEGRVVIDPPEGLFPDA